MFVDVADSRVFVERSGCGDDVVVGLAGSLGTSELWHPPFRILAESCRTIAYDHLGTGLTSAPVDRVTFEDQVDVLDGLLGIFAEGHRCILAGDASMNAVAIEAAHRWPGRMSGLVLVSAGLDYGPTETVEQFVVGLRHAFEPTIESFVEVAIPEDTTGDYQNWLKAIIARTGGERAAALVESFYSVDIRPRLRHITVPTVVIHGALDRLPTSPLAASQEIADTIPNARLVVLANAGHVPTLTRPDAIAAEIMSLLNRT